MAAYYACYFAAIGVLEPYLVLLWGSFGFTPAQIGVLAAIPSCIAIVAPSLWTAIADVTRRGERIFAWNTIATACVALLLPSALGPILAALLLATLAFLRAPLIPLANSMTFRALNNDRSRYASIRLWGTIGYILAAIAAGVFIDRVGIALGILGAGVALGGAAAIAATGPSRRGTPLSSAQWRAMFDLVRDRHLLVVLATTALARVSSGAYDTFFSIHLAVLGFSKTFAGCAWALAAGSELILMLGWHRLRVRRSARQGLMIALASHALRWLLSAFAEGPIAVLAIQPLHAFTFGAFYLASVERMDELAPAGLRATAQGLFASCAFGLGGTLGSLWAGALFARLGMAGLYMVATVLSAGATLFYAVRGQSAEALAVTGHGKAAG
ncbi:MAG TPA: MFS transporter [Candidatus Baltobacteraceae bacterium]|nr:MFS transporter [Candidatus Baltobacteraceae bacterium]